MQKAGEIIMDKGYLCIEKTNLEQGKIVREAGRFNGKASVYDIEQEFMRALKHMPAVYTEKQFREAKKSNPRGLPNHIFYEVAEDGTFSLAARMYIKEYGKVSFQK